MIIISLPRFENDSLVNLGSKGNPKVQFRSFVSDCQNKYDELLNLHLTMVILAIVYACSRCATMAELRQGLATLNSNNFVVSSQERKVWVLVFLE